MNVRILAASALDEVRLEKRSINTALPRALSEARSVDAALLQELVFGSCRWFYFLNEIVNNHLQRPLHRRDESTRTLLILGAYQLIFTRIPDHAAIHETVEAAKELGLAKTTGLINAVLRAISREDSPLIDEAAIHASFPDWIPAKLANNWPDQAEQILKASNAHPPMFLRVNQAKTSRDEYLKQLETLEIEAQPCAFAPNGIRLTKPCDVLTLPGFESGLVSVQDEAAQLCTQLMDLAPNMRVLDACSAPGGKTCAILEADSSIALTALDQDAKRLKRVEENLARLELNASTHASAAEDLEQWFDGEAFDRILLDAPCSATGVIRRHPDIKLLRDPADLKKLADLQLHLLTSLWKTLKVGGKLVYATCSIFPQENARVIERFLKGEPSAKCLPINQPWGVDTDYGKQLFPQEDGHDGFFYAVLSKEH